MTIRELVVNFAACIENQPCEPLLDCIRGAFAQFERRERSRLAAEAAEKAASKPACGDAVAERFAKRDAVMVDLFYAMRQLREFGCIGRALDALERVEVALANDSV